MISSNTQKSPAPQGLTTHLNCYPDFVYVLMSARGEAKAELTRRAQMLLLAAMAFYGKQRGMAIVDRDGTNFEVALNSTRDHSIAAFHLGEQYFGKLRMDHIPATLIPGVRPFEQVIR
jgi:hypothetical protein